MAEETKKQNHDITEVIDYFAGGFQRTNRFSVSITKSQKENSDVDTTTTQTNTTEKQTQTNLTTPEVKKEENTPSSTDTFWASEVQIPAQTLYYYPEAFSPSGPPITIPVRREYDDRFLMSFIVDQDWKVRKYFEDWYDNMFTVLNPQLLSQKSNTVFPRNTASNLAKIEIKALNVNGEEKQIITLYEAYPKLLLPSQFSHDIPNQYLTLTVDFNYRYYKITSTTSGLSGDTDITGG